MRGETKDEQMEGRTDLREAEGRKEGEKGRKAERRRGGVSPLPRPGSPGPRGPARPGGTAPAPQPWGRPAPHRPPPGID